MKYDSTIDRWDNIFSAETPAFPRTRSSGNIAFDKGLEWLTENTTGVLDFGCGNGIVLFLCALHGTATHIGIDLSVQAIRNAEAAARMAPCGEFHFECGSLEALQRVGAASVDAVILSNIVWRNSFTGGVLFSILFGANGHTQNLQDNAFSVFRCCAKKPRLNLYPKRSQFQQDTMRYRLILL